MDRLLKHILRTTRMTRRCKALAMSVVVCLWAVVATAHVHILDDDASGDVFAACGICLSLSTGAAPPAYRIPERPIQVASALIAAPEVPAPTPTVPSSYLSRGPPGL